MHADQARQVRRISQLPLLVQLYSNIRRAAEMGHSCFTIQLPDSPEVAQAKEHLIANGYRCRYYLSFTLERILEVRW